MTKPTILVAGATGKTGFHTARLLLERNYPVRALVRSIDARSESLQKLGAEIRQGNLAEPAQVSQAMRGVQRAYFCAPLASGGLGASTVFASAAQECKLEFVAVMSQWLADRHHPSIHTRETALADTVFSWMPDVDVATVNPGWFADNYMAALEPIAQFGLMPMPLGAGLNAPPSNEDIARVVAAMLIDPAPHVGKTYRPTGPKLLSPWDIAATCAKVLGRPVRYVDAPVAMFAKVAKALGFPVFVIEQLRWYFQDYQKNAFAVGAPTDAVQVVGGKPAEDFETIVRRYVAASPFARRTPGSQLKAMWGMTKAMLTPAPNFEKYALAHDFPQLLQACLAADSKAWRATHDPERGVPAVRSPALDRDPAAGTLGLEIGPAR